MSQLFVTFGVSLIILILGFLIGRESARSGYLSKLEEEKQNQKGDLES